MRPIFSILSALYIAGIFILPRIIPGSIISKIWNPYSLLHIPMYGVLMILLILSFGFNLTPLMAASLSSSSFLFSGGIASVVGILDEIHQAYIPQRHASVIDVMLDVTGIVLTGMIVYSYQKRKVKNGREYTRN